MKKILAFVLTLALLCGMSTVFANAMEESTDYFYIPAPEGVIGSETYGFNNPNGWEDVYVYATGGRSEDDNNKMKYPGVKLNEHWDNEYGNVYTFSFAVGYYDTIIFNDGKYDITEQVKATLAEEFAEYYVNKTGEPIPENGKIVITETYGITNTAVYFAAECDWTETQNVRFTEMMGNNCLHRSKTYSPYGLGMYVSVDGVVYDIKTAYDNKVIDYMPYGVDFEGFENHYVLAENPDMELVHRCYDALSEEYGIDSEDDSVIYCEPYGMIDDLVLLHGHHGGGNACVIAKEQIGEYYFYNGEPCGTEEHNSVGMYILTPDDKIYTLYEAYTEGVITDLEKAAELTNGESIYGIYGKSILPKLGIDTENSDWQKYYDERSFFYSVSNSEAPDFVLVMAAESVIDEKPAVHRLGEFVIYSNQTYSGYEIGAYIYFPEKDEVYDFETAFGKFPEHQSDFIISLDEYIAPFVGVVGNANGDSTVNINDVTHIQKRLVGRDTLSNYPSALEEKVSDFNNDGKVNIKDATAIQKHLVGLI